MRKIVIISLVLVGLLLSCSPEKLPDNTKIDPTPTPNPENNSNQQGNSNQFVRTVQLSSAGTLSNHISDSEKYTIEKLKIVGEINGDDIKLLRDMAGSNYRCFHTDGILEDLDLSEARIVAGGDRYIDADTLRVYSQNEDGTWIIIANWVNLNGYRYTLTTSDEIPSYSFFACKLKRISYPMSLKSIGDGAFSECRYLESISIPKTVDVIKGNPFIRCCSLQAISVDGNNISYDSRDNCYALIETKTNKLIKGCRYTIIPNSVTMIDDCAFSGCENLKSINIPNSVKSIGSNAFSYCRDLVQISLPNSITHISIQAFMGCGLTILNLPSSLEVIGKQAFWGCRELTTVYIPNSVVEIHEKVFEDCNKIKTINSDITNVFSISDDVFSTTVYNSADLHVPENCKSKYQTTAGWKNFVNIY